MILMNGLGGLGVTCSPPFAYHPGSNTCDCPYGTTYNPNRDTCEGTPTGMPTSGQGSGGGFDWGGLLTSVTTGLVRGLVDDAPTGPPGPGQPGYIPPPPPPAPAWYTTPTGMIGLGMGALVLFMVLRK
jgi:hypothetical protein